MISKILQIFGLQPRISSVFLNHYEDLFLTVGQNNFENKIPYFWKLSGWRPSFKYYNKWISLFGTILCIAVMFLMSYVTALITLVCIVLLYVFIKSRKPDVNWGSSTQSQHFITALKSVQYLTKVEDHVKNFRCSVIYVPKCWVDLSFNSRVILDFFLVLQLQTSEPFKFKNSG